MKDEAAHQTSSQAGSHGESDRYWSPDRSETHPAVATPIPEEISQNTPNLKAETAEEIVAKSTQFGVEQEAVGESKEQTLGIILQSI